MAKHHDKKFKLDAVQYYHDHRDLGLQGCASSLNFLSWCFAIMRSSFSAVPTLYHEILD